MYLHLFYLEFIAKLEKMTLEELCSSTCRVLCRSWFSCIILVWKNTGIWSKGPCGKAMYYLPTATYCCFSGNFSSWWLSASLARCFRWGSFRFVSWALPFFFIIINFQFIFLTSCNKSFSLCVVTSFYRDNSCIILLLAILSSPIWCRWYVPQGTFLNFYYSGYFRHSIWPFGYL